MWGIHANWIDFPAFTMNPSTELFLVEMHRLFAEQTAQLDRLFDKHIAPSTVARATPAPPPSATASAAPAPAPSIAIAPASSTTVASVIASLTPAPPATASVAPTPSTVDEPFHVAVLPPPVLLKSEADEHHWFVEALNTDLVPSSKQDRPSVPLQQSTPSQHKHESVFAQQSPYRYEGK